jgi:anti-anti-sigma regulatory factor
VTHAATDVRSAVVTLDVSGLRFADAPACRAVVDAGRAAGGRLRVRGAGPTVRRLLELHGAARVPGLLDG